MAAAWCAGTAGAQPPAGQEPTTPISPALEPFEGRPVGRIALIVVARREGASPAPLEPALEQLVRNSLRLTEGTPFSARTVSEDISRLTRLGRFRSVESRVTPLADGSVEVSYRFLPQMLIEAVQTVGNRAFADEELFEGVNALVGTPADPTQLERACRRIEARYREKGYFNTLVTVDQEELDKNQILIFRIREGERTKVSSIVFQGVKSYAPAQVKDVLKTKEAWLLDRGPLDNDLLDEDIASVIKFYKDRGHLDVRADRIVTPSPDGREAKVTFVVDEGPIYTLRDVRLELADPDDPAFTVDQLRGLLTIKSGDVYSLEKLLKSVQSIEQSYGILGYADAKVDRRELRDPDQPVVDVLLRVRQGRAFKTGVITIQGNSGTRDDVIRERLTIRPDRPLDTTEIEESKKRLGDTRLFKPGSVRLTLQPEREDEPGYRDVLVEVTETNTGSFNFGAGITSDAGVFGTISINQRNFDITDWPDSWGELFTGESFHGGGQTLALALQPGSEVRNFSLGLSDPYAFGTDYSAGATVYFRDRLYSSYDERRYGAEFRVGRRYGSRWTIAAPLRIENVELSNIDADAPTAYYDVADSATLASIGLSLTRASYDNMTFPSKGSKAEAGIDFITGDFNFMKFHAEYARYFKLTEDVLGNKTVLQLASRVGYIPQDSDEVPFYERYFLGGQTFRGFDYRAVAPIGIRHDNGQISEDTVGGNFSFFAGAEVRRSLFTELVSGVAFIDSGTVDSDVSFSHYRVSAGLGLRIYVEQLSPLPIAFDFGFPILKEPDDQTRIFTFSIDLPFR